MKANRVVTGSWPALHPVGLNVSTEREVEEVKKEELLVQDLTLSPDPRDEACGRGRGRGEGDVHRRQDEKSKCSVQTRATWSILTTNENQEELKELPWELQTQDLEDPYSHIINAAFVMCVKQRFRLFCPAGTRRKDSFGVLSQRAWVWQICQILKCYRKTLHILFSVWRLLLISINIFFSLSITLWLRPIFYLLMFCFFRCGFDK